MVPKQYRKTRRRSRKITEDYGKKPKDCGNLRDFGRLREEAGRLRKTTEDYGRLRKTTEDYGKKPEDNERLLEEAERLRKMTGRRRKTTEDYGKKPEDYGRLREEAERLLGEAGRLRKTTGRSWGEGGEPEFQKSRDPEIQRSRNPEIQKSRNPADVETSPKGRPKKHIGYTSVYLHNHIHIKLIESISTKATQNTPPPCRKHGPFWTRHGVGELLFSSAYSRNWIRLM